MSDNEKPADFSEKIANPEFQQRIKEWRQLLRGNMTDLRPVEISPPSCPDAFSPERNLSQKIVCERTERSLDCVEFHLEFASQPKITPETAESFLLKISQIEIPQKPTPILIRPRLVFELIGIGGRVIFQIGCDELVRLQVKRAIKEFYPDVEIREERNCLSKAFNSVPEDYPVVILNHFLSQDFVFPIKTHQTFEKDDPQEDIIGQLMMLKEDEFGLVQIILVRIEDFWREMIQQMLISKTPLPLEQVFDFTDKSQALVKQKLSRPFFAGVVRTAGRAKIGEQAYEISKALSLMVRQWSNNNFLRPFRFLFEKKGVRKYDPLQRFSWQSGAILNSEELAPLVHIPGGPRAHRLLRLVSAKTKPVPAIANNLECDVIVGFNRHKEKESGVSLLKDQRLRHTYVIGVSGTGKSTLLLDLILQDICVDRGLAVLDPHGDLIEKILAYVPEKRLNDVILFDPSDEEYPIGFNILSSHSDIEKNLLASDLVAVFRRLSTSWGDQMNAVLANAILAFLESNQGGTLADLRRFLTEKEFRERFLATVQDEQVIYYWKKEFPFLSGKPQGPILTRLDTFLRPKLIRYMVSQKENKIDFTKVMNEGKIFLAKLSQGIIGEENSYLLGSLLVSKFHQTAMSRQQIKESERRSFYLYIDEFHNFITPSMDSILTAGRKYGLGLILAHQELRQLWNKDADVASAVLANSCTRVCFRLGEWDAKKMAEGFSFFDANDLQRLDRGKAIVRVEKPENDFNLTTFAWEYLIENKGEEWKEKIRMISREKYAVPRQTVMEEIKEKMDLTSVKEVLPKTPTFPKKKEKEEIISREIISEQAPAEIKPVEKIPKPISQDTGRGGSQHKYLQDLIKRCAQDKGYKAEIEKAVLDGTGSVDVALEKNSQTIACEISITTTPEQELGNIQKCLKAGFHWIIVFSPDPKTLRQIKEVVSSSIDANDQERIRYFTYFTYDEYLVFLEEIEAQSASGDETTVKGYKVKSTYRALTGEEKKARKLSITQTILGSLRRLKGIDSGEMDK
jgi:hypothetical protein